MNIPQIQVNVPRFEAIARIVATLVFALGAFGALPHWLFRTLVAKGAADSGMSGFQFTLLLGCACWCASYAIGDLKTVFKLRTDPATGNPVIGTKT